MNEINLLGVNHKLAADDKEFEKKLFMKEVRIMAIIIALVVIREVLI